MCRVESIDSSIGPGNVLMIVIESDSATEVVTAFGRKGVSAEQVAADACDEAERFLSSDAPVGIHLADQLLVPMALSGGGTFRTLEPTPHTATNVVVIQKFVDVPIRIDADSGRTYRVTVGDARCP